MSNDELIRLQWLLVKYRDELKKELDNPEITDLGESFTDANVARDIGDVCEDIVKIFGY